MKYLKNLNSSQTLTERTCQKSHLIYDYDLTCTGKSVTTVSGIAGTAKAVRYVGTHGKLAASSVVVSAFIHIYALCHPCLTHCKQFKPNINVKNWPVYNPV